MWAPGSGHADPEVPDHVDIAAAREVGTNSLAHTVRLRRPEIFFVVVQRDSNPCFQSATRFHNGRWKLGAVD